MEVFFWTSITLGSISTLGAIIFFVTDVYADAMVDVKVRGEGPFHFVAVIAIYVATAFYIVSWIIWKFFI